MKFRETKSKILSKNVDKRSQNIQVTHLETWWCKGPQTKMLPINAEPVKDWNVSEFSSFWIVKFLNCQVSSEVITILVSTWISADQLNISWLATPCWRDPTRSKQLSTVAIVGFQFGLYHVVAPLSFSRSISLALFVNHLSLRKVKGSN